MSSVPIKADLHTRKLPFAIPKERAHKQSEVKAESRKCHLLVKPTPPTDTRRPPPAACPLDLLLPLTFLSHSFDLADNLTLFISEINMT